VNSNMPSAHRVLLEKSLNFDIFATISQLNNILSGLCGLERPYVSVGKWQK